MTRRIRLSVLLAALATLGSAAFAPTAAMADTQEEKPTPRELLDTCDNIFGRSFCALGDGATSPIVSGVQLFREEFLAHITQRGCPIDPVASTVFAGAHA